MKIPMATPTSMPIIVKTRLVVEPLLPLICAACEAALAADKE
jgi:hypothetical protein